jgi:outer membrane protein assembly factor BamD
LKIRALALLVITLALMIGGCKSAQNRNNRPTVSPELLNLSKEEIFNRAEDLLERKKWTKAREYYGHVYENYPNDPLGRRSLLRIADTYFRQGDSVSLVEAQYKYRDFINRYPGSEFADFAMLQIANVSYKQMERPDRDQAKTLEAIQKYREMLAAYPNSSLRPDAEEKLKSALDRVARHEHVVARFYIQRRNWNAAITRLMTVVNDYPDYSERAGTFYDLGTALEGADRKGEARLYFERVVAEFPDGEYAKRAKVKLQESAS